VEKPFPYRIYPIGDQALTLDFGILINDEINAQVMALFYWLKEENLQGIKDIIPAYASISVVYDAALIRKWAGNGSAYTYMEDYLTQALQQLEYLSLPSSRELRIPVCYHQRLAPDLVELCEEKKMDLDELVAIHISRPYRVYMIGFLPGFAYMGSLDERIMAPRKQTPRTHVAAGSVGIAGVQTGIYPFASPGGWQLIGQTPLSLFNANAEVPTLFQPGDLVRFEPISLDQFYQLKNNPS
jgi:inhibitor of KinA